MDMLITAPRRRIQDFVGTLYDLLLRPEGLMGVLTTLLAVVGADAGVMLTFADDGSVLDLWQSGFPELCASTCAMLLGGRYLGHRRGKDGSFACEKTGPSGPDAHEHAKDCVAGHESFITYANLPLDEERGLHLQLLRDPNHGSFSRDELEWLETIAPHLRRAVKLASRMRMLDRWQQTSRAVMDRFPVPVLLVQRDGMTAFLNSAAQALLERSALLAHADGRLKGANNGITEELMGAVQRTLDEGSDQLVRLRTNGSSHSVMALITRPNIKKLATTPEIASVCLVEIGDEEVVSSETLRAYYGLTAAESKLASKLAAGHSLKEVAEASETSVHTLRCHLKAIFAKTGTSRQAELVNHLLRGPGLLGTPEA